MGLPPGAIDDAIGDAISERIGESSALMSPGPETRDRGNTAQLPVPRLVHDCIGKKRARSTGDARIFWL